MSEQLNAGDGFSRRVGAARNSWQRPRVRLGAIIALAAAAGLIAWIVVDRTGSSSSSKSTQATSASAEHVGPVAVSQQAMKSFSKEFGEPIYWMGPKAGYTYELTRTSDGKIYVRYLPPGVKARDTRSDYTIVVTYPFPDSYSALKNVGKGQEIDVPGGGIALVDTNYPKSVHMSFPGVDYQVEVYDPSPARSLQVALSGDVSPVG